MVKFSNQLPNANQDQVLVHEDATAQLNYEQLTEIYCLPGQQHFSNSEILLAKNRRRSIPLMNTELADKTVKLLKGESLPGNTTFDASLWHPTQLMISISLLLISREIPLLIVAKPTAPVPMWFALYCCLYFDPSNLTSWHDGDTELPNNTPSDEVQNHWLIRAAAETRLADNCFKPFGAHREQFRRLRAEWRRLQKYLHLNSRFSPQHTTAAVVADFVGRFDLLLWDCTRAASAAFELQEQQQAADGRRIAHAFDELNLQQRHAVVSCDLRVLVGFDIFRRPDPAWIAPRFEAADIATHSQNAQLTRRHLQRFMCTLYLINQPLPARSAKHPRENPHYTDGGLDSFFGTFKPQNTYFFRYEMPVPTPRQRDLAKLDCSFFRYLYEQLGQLPLKLHAETVFENVYPQVLAAARLKRARDTGSTTVPKPEGEEPGAGVPALPLPAAEPWSHVLVLAEDRDLRPVTQMTPEEREWFRRNKRLGTAFVPQGARVAHFLDAESMGEEEEQPTELVEDGVGGGPARPDDNPPPGDNGGNGEGPAPGDGVAANGVTARREGGDNAGAGGGQPQQENIAADAEVGREIPLDELLNTRSLPRSNARFFADDELSGPESPTFSKNLRVVAGNEDALSEKTVLVEEKAPAARKQLIVPEEPPQPKTTVTCANFDDLFAEELNPITAQKVFNFRPSMPKIHRARASDAAGPSLLQQRNIFMEEIRRSERSSFVDKIISPAN